MIYPAEQTEALEQSNAPDLPRVLKGAQDYVYEGQFPSLLDMPASLA
jgi:hypothetical protein